jgi:hypothetical protein
MPRLEEIPMNLDTLSVDMDALTVVLVWRGRFSPTDADRPSTVLIVDEPLTASPRPPESYRPKLRELFVAETSAEDEAAAAERELEALTAGEASLPAHAGSATVAASVGGGVPPAPTSASVS